MTHTSWFSDVISHEFAHLWRHLEHWSCLCPHMFFSITQISIFFRDFITDLFFGFVFWARWFLIEFLNFWLQTNYCVINYDSYWCMTNQWRHKSKKKTFLGNDSVEFLVIFFFVHLLEFLLFFFVVLLELLVLLLLLLLICLLALDVVWDVVMSF